MRMLSPLFDVESLFADDVLIKMARRFSKEPGTALFYSGSVYDSAKISFLALFPCETLKIENELLTHIKAGEAPIRQQMFKNPWDVLKEHFNFASTAGSLPEWIGYLAYEMGASSDWDCTQPRFAGSYPDAYFQRSVLLITYDKATQKFSVAADLPAALTLPSTQQEWVKRLTEKEGMLDFFREIEQDVILVPSECDCTIVEPLDSFESYSQKVLTAKELIAAGEIYQVNLSHRTRYQSHADPFDIFMRLNHLNPAPFSVYFSVTVDHQIVSSSPEDCYNLKRGDWKQGQSKGLLNEGKLKRRMRIIK